MQELDLHQSKHPWASGASEQSRPEEWLRNDCAAFLQPVWGKYLPAIKLRQSEQICAFTVVLSVTSREYASILNSISILSSEELWKSRVARNCCHQKGRNPRTSKAAVSMLPRNVTIDHTKDCVNASAGFPGL
jgi:hypothetical protein